MRVLLLGNPASGAGRGLERAKVAERTLTAAGARVTTVLTERRGHAREVLEARPSDCDRVIACGGDGLVSEAAGALAGGDLPLAIIPAGRGNDFARGVGVPLDVRASALLAVGGRVRRVDLGACGDRTFCTVAACGLDAEVSRRGRGSRLPLPGPGVYLLEALRAIASFTPSLMRIEAGDVVIEQPCLFVAAANTRTYGGGFLIAPRAATDDGLLDVCVVRSMGRLRSLALFPLFFRGSHESLPDVRTFRCERLTVSASPPLGLEADGERLGDTPATLSCVRAALPLVLPAA